MNTTTDNEKMQSESTKSEKLSRVEIRRQEKAAAKSMKSEKKNNANKQALLQRNEDTLQKADEILKNLKTQTSGSDTHAAETLCGQPSGSPFLKKVRCGICGHIMARVGKKKSYYMCYTPRVTDQYACPVERMPEKDFEEAVLKQLRIQDTISDLMLPFYGNRNK